MTDHLLRRPRLEGRAEGIYADELNKIHRRTDRLFAYLLILQWIAGVVLAFVLSPRTWLGQDSSIHVHVYAAVLLGAAITVFPVILALRRPGALSTRCTLAVAQMLWSALLIHLTGGRIETHFHVFGSLALLAFYRDPLILAPATIVVAADHFLRGLLWPESVYGVINPEWWRFLEHAGWVLFIDFFLIKNCLQSRADVARLAERQAALESSERDLRDLADGLEEQVAARTSELSEKNDRLGELSQNLILASRKAGMAEVATGVLHNIGNVLNSVNVSADQIRRATTSSKADRLGQVSKMIDEAGPDLGRFLTEDPRGKLIPSYLSRLATELQVERTSITEETDVLEQGIRHIKSIVAKQQTLAKTGGLSENCLASALIDDALALQALSFDRHKIDVERDYDGLPELIFDRHKVMQILFNLVRNAIQSMKIHDGERNTLRVAARYDDGTFQLTVSDTGRGITEEERAQLFSFGFTTKVTGHGFGLHNCALMADEMGGHISVESAGRGKGASFTLSLSAATAKKAA